MKILFIGDIVGEIGRNVVKNYLPLLKKKYRPQLTIANGENSANGKGITEKIYKDLLSHGIDVITLGNHTWDNKDIFNFIDNAAKLIRPINFASANPGKGYTIVTVNQSKIAIINVQGRVFLPTIQDPFLETKKIIDEIKKITPIIIIDFHAEATSEKQAFSWYLDGQVSAVLGTHTHVQTNDARILPKGTAYLSDVGMTGAYDSILGFKMESIIERFITQLPAKHEVVESGRTILSACYVEIDDITGKTKKIEPIIINDDHPFIN